MKLTTSITVTRPCDTCGAEGWLHSCRFGDGCPCAARIECPECHRGRVDVELTIAGLVYPARPVLLRLVELVGYPGVTWDGELTAGEEQQAREALRQAWRRALEGAAA